MIFLSDSDPIQRTLFVCTGNIFRSLTAEVAVRMAGNIDVLMKRYGGS
ncbi:MAG: hypothetical protein AABM33_04810 [Pseudomonadota bacterium]